MKADNDMSHEYKVTTSKSFEDPAWDNFLVSTPGGHHVHTSHWARVKSLLGWEATRVLVTVRNEIVAGAQILIRSRPLLGSVAYVTKGPLCRHEDPDLVTKVLHEITNICRKNSCRLIIIQPPNNGKYLNGLLTSLDFRTSSLELAPTASLVIDLSQGPETIMARMKHDTRRNVRRSMRAGIAVRYGDKSDLKLFYSLYLSTAQRQGFMPYKMEYFDLLWQTFSPQNWITLLIACYENEAVSAQLLIPFGDTVIAKIVGWSGGHSSRHPNDALYWASILWSIEHGYRYFDFEGVDPQNAIKRLNGQKSPSLANSTQDTIKYGYGGEVRLYPPAFEYLPNKMLNWGYRHIMRMKEGSSLTHRLLEHLRKR